MQHRTYVTYQFRSICQSGNLLLVLASTVIFGFGPQRDPGPLSFTSFHCHKTSFALKTNVSHMHHEIKRRGIWWPYSNLNGLICKLKVSLQCGSRRNYPQKNLL
jgi:hypothetical protein